MEVVAQDCVSCTTICFPDLTMHVCGGRRLRRADHVWGLHNGGPIPPSSLDAFIKRQNSLSNLA
ncbi:hypothetical protein EGR_10902 [Echinococcus granulosus]|uniref:Uncharacterized protein n=1 Tax=Echinococcus granulosus TaxID=6210 RepID=W6U176_ECHGR|nr:hypothetical protein EGR_10902 [Echinococcus granulosus]EUB54236.1 hypothetical protein EGR_10902 [Echinococcus granulosus]